jgi:hypothetical protein
MSVDGSVFVHQITIRVVLHVEVVAVVPVIEDLTAENVAADSPCEFPTFREEELVGAELVFARRKRQVSMSEALYLPTGCMKERRCQLTSWSTSNSS